MADERVEHLKMIQDAIKRMANNCFLLKGWGVTLVSAMLVFAAKEADKPASKSLITIVWFPVLLFCLLDMYYLWQENLFCALYEKTLNGEVQPFSLDTKSIRDKQHYLGGITSVSIWLFYLALITIPYAIALVLWQ